MQSIKLSELIQAVELDSDEHSNWVDLQTGTAVHVEHSLINAVEENDEDTLKDVPDWQKPEVEIARAVVGDSGERFVDAPSKFDFNEYRHMERFIGTVQDSEAVEQLWRAIKGRGAFRYFKDTANRFGLLKPWYAYRNDALKKFVRDWATAHEVPVIDDLSCGDDPDGDVPQRERGRW